LNKNRLFLFDVAKEEQEERHKKKLARKIKRVWMRIFTLNDSIQPHGRLRKDIKKTQ
jgi:hypothetical protein